MCLERQRKFNGKHGQIESTRTHALHCWAALSTKAKIQQSALQTPPCQINFGKICSAYSFPLFWLQCWGAASQVVTFVVCFVVFHYICAPLRAYAVRCTISIHRRCTINCVLRKFSSLQRRRWWWWWRPCLHLHRRRFCGRTPSSYKE